MLNEDVAIYSAAIQAAILSNLEKTEDVLLLDITLFSIDIETA
jgi:molecular chaperone DnaK (HSP70)